MEAEIGAPSDVVLSVAPAAGNELVEEHLVVTLDGAEIEVTELRRRPRLPPPHRGTGAARPPRGGLPGLVHRPGRPAAAHRHRRRPLPAPEPLLRVRPPHRLRPLRVRRARGALPPRVGLELGRHAGRLHRRGQPADRRRGRPPSSPARACAATSPTSSSPCCGPTTCRPGSCPSTPPASTRWTSTRSPRRRSTASGWPPTPPRSPRAPPCCASPPAATPSDTAFLTTTGTSVELTMLEVTAVTHGDLPDDDVTQPAQLG